MVKILKETIVVCLQSIISAFEIRSIENDNKIPNVVMTLTFLFRSQEVPYLNLDTETG
jgi:hypothetical protein